MTGLRSKKNVYIFAKYNKKEANKTYIHYLYTSQSNVNLCKKNKWKHVLKNVVLIKHILEEKKRFVDRNVCQN